MILAGKLFLTFLTVGVTAFLLGWLESDNDFITTVCLYVVFICYFGMVAAGMYWVWA